MPNKLTNDDYKIATLPMDTGFTEIKFPVVVMPIQANLERIHITGGGDDAKTKLCAWDMEGTKYNRMGNKLRDQLKRVFDKIGFHLTLDAFISHSEDGTISLVVHDAMPTEWHLDEDYTCTLRDRLSSLDDFLLLCSANSRNRIFGAKKQVFYNWDELFSALFESFEGHQGLCTLFPQASIRSFDSVYKLGEDQQWIIATGEQIMAERQTITAAWEASGDTLEQDLQKWVVATQKRLDDGYSFHLVLPEGFDITRDGKIVDKRDLLPESMEG